ncbi:hypothetical protein [Solidesulfovibrio sp. C21]|uniref:hypothetical protein n=1 Tax=Solidesulfovibrio sp. C21 TaxID=3398613 RepID=UPI0039FC37AC
MSYEQPFSRLIPGHLGYCRCAIAMVYHLSSVVLTDITGTIEPNANFLPPHINTMFYLWPGSTWTGIHRGTVDQN